MTASCDGGLRAVFLLLFVFVATAAYSVEPSERLADPALEARARVISQELRCLVCQNQSIDDSDAELAADLRRLVRERIVAGDSNEQVISFLVARYGDFVRLKPPFDPRTWLLWLGPIVVLLGGCAIVVTTLRRQKKVADAEDDDSSEPNEI